MTIEKLEISRYQDTNKKGKFYFGTQIGKTKFHYLITKPKTKITNDERYTNNFYGGYLINNKILLLSIEGISIFDFDYKNRKNISLNRRLNLYHELENFHNNCEFEKLEKILLKFL